MPGSSLRVLLTAQQIHDRILEMGAQIDQEYGDGNLHLVCILKGACFFMADLARAIRLEVVIDFMGISSYGRGKTTSGAVKVTKDLDTAVEGAHVLLVEDIVDSGVTLNYLIKMLEQRKPRSIKVAALLDKPERRQAVVDVSYVGFQIPDEFVVGYGLDFAERYRKLPDVCVLEGPQVA